MGYAAIVLAGGSGRRMGGVIKPLLAVAGESMLHRVLRAVSDADHIVVVGPIELAGHLPRGVHLTQEQPAGTGPVAGVAAGLKALQHLASPSSSTATSAAATGGVRGTTERPADEAGDMRGREPAHGLTGGADGGPSVSEGGGLAHSVTGSADGGARGVTGAPSRESGGLTRREGGVPAPSTGDGAGSDPARGEGSGAGGGTIGDPARGEGGGADGGTTGDPARREGDGAGGGTTGAAGGDGVSGADGRAGGDTVGDGPAHGDRAADVPNADVPNADVPSAQGFIAVVGGDLPFLSASALALLRQNTHDVAVYVDDEGRRQPMATVWSVKALIRAVAQVPPSMNALIGSVARIAEVPWPATGGAIPPWYDCDTPEELERAERWLR